jgi:flagellar L-ring protein precursor FlgH
LSDDFNGKGTIQRSGKLAAQITVTVQSVEPNGDLVVAGRQLIEVNDEKQHIVLSGKVRPVDIGENNTVVSTRLADANISYVGDGILAEKQQPGIISRILHWLRLL